MKTWLIFIQAISLLLIVSCSQTELAESYTTTENFELLDEETLVEAAGFPIGNVWSGGHAPWGLSKGTDLGGPSDDFSYNAFGSYTSYNRKVIDFDRELDILQTEFNSITPEVALKMHNIAVTPDSLDFTAADAMMNFCRSKWNQSGWACIVI